MGDLLEPLAYLIFLGTLFTYFTRNAQKEGNPQDAFSYSALSMLFWMATSWKWILDYSAEAHIHFSWLFILLALYSLLVVVDSSIVLLGRQGKDKVNPFE